MMVFAHILLVIYFIVCTLNSDFFSSQPKSYTAVFKTDTDIIKAHYIYDSHQTVKNCSCEGLLG
jgi:hypothetical protein